MACNNQHALNLRILPDEISMSMTAAEFAAELEKCGFRIVGTWIVSDDCPGVAWKPVKRMGRIDRARTLHKVIQKRDIEIARRKVWHR